MSPEGRGANLLSSLSLFPQIQNGEISPALISRLMLILCQVLCCTVLCFTVLGSPYVSQVGTELGILLPQHLRVWDYRCTPPHLANARFLEDNGEAPLLPYTKP